MCEHLFQLSALEKWWTNCPEILCLLSRVSFNQSSFLPTSEISCTWTMNYEISSAWTELCAAPWWTRNIVCQPSSLIPLNLIAHVLAKDIRIRPNIRFWLSFYLELAVANSLAGDTSENIFESLFKFQRWTAFIIELLKLENTAGWLINNNKCHSTWFSKSQCHIPYN